jgi:hypothetical protein
MEEIIRYIVAIIEGLFTLFRAWRKEQLFCSQPAKTHPPA